MENVKIDGIGNIDVVKDLFKSVKCLEDDNIFLVLLNRDYVASSVENNTFYKNNAVNKAVAEVVNEFNNKLNDKQKIVFSRNVYCGFLINVVKDGIGVIPLKNSGQLIPNIKAFITDLEKYIFIKNDEIEKIEIQKLPLRFSTKKLAIYFKDLDGANTPWTLPMKHKLVSYQEENYNKLVQKLS